MVLRCASASPSPSRCRRRSPSDACLRSLQLRRPVTRIGPPRLRILSRSAPSVVLSSSPRMAAASGGGRSRSSSGLRRSDPGSGTQNLHLVDASRQGGPPWAARRLEFAILTAPRRSASAMDGTCSTTCINDSTTCINDPPDRHRQAPSDVVRPAQTSPRTAPSDTLQADG